MTLITKPDFTYVWASGGAIVAPNDAKKQQGWVAEAPPFQYDNWLQNRQDQMLAHINQRGMCAWDGLTNYEAGGLSYVQGSDGKIYKSVAASGPTTTVQDPTTDATDTYWTIAFADVGAFLTQAAGDVRYTQRSNNLSDLTNIATARTNLGVYSVAQTDAAIAASVPVGSVITVTSTVVPPGTLKMNGAAVSRATYAALFNYLVTAAGFTSQAFTVTIASPAVFTKSTHGFSSGERLRLSTTGSLPTGLATNIDYFVERIDANTFYLTTGTVYGTRVVTTGTQSGTHSYLQSLYGLGDGTTTFNVPDARAEVIRGWDDGRGVDTGRVIGSPQKGSLAYTDIDGISNNAVTSIGNLNPNTGRNAVSFDTPVASDYANTLGSSASETSTTQPSVALTNFGVQRVRNIAFLHCIKF